MHVKPVKPIEQTRVLVVEDEPRLRDVLSSGISEMDFETTTARSGEDAVRIMETCPHDIVLLDLNLPGMDGLETLDIIHDRWPGVAVIILTGFGDLEAAQTAIRMDVVDFLTKPASLGDLEKALDRARRVCTATPEPDGLVPDSKDHRPTTNDAPQTIQEVEKKQILDTLQRNNGNRAKTAAELDISVRTLYYRLADYDRSDMKNGN